MLESKGGREPRQGQTSGPSNTRKKKDKKEAEEKKVRAEGVFFRMIRIRERG